MNREILVYVGGNPVRKTLLRCCITPTFSTAPPGSRVNRREFLSRDAPGNARDPADDRDLARITKGSGRYAGIRMRDKLQQAILDFDPATRVPRPDVKAMDKT